MLRAMNRLHRVLGVDQGLFEQSQAELLLQHAAHAAIDKAHRHLPFAHAGQQVLHVARLEGDAHVHAGRQGQGPRLLLRRCQPFVDERADPAALGEHEAVEAELLAEDAGQQLLRGVGGHAVDRGVGGHHAQGPALLDARLPGRQEDFPHAPLGNLHRTALQAADGLALAGIVAQAGDHLVRGGNVAALGRANDRLRDPRAEERIFAESLFIAAQPRVADRLDHEGEVLVYADGAGLPGHGGVDAAQQFHVPGAAQRGAFGEDRAAGAHQAVRPLLALEERNAQPGAGGDPLQPVEELGLLPRAFVQDRVREGEESAARAEALDQGARGELLHALGLFRDGLAQPSFVDAGHVDLPHLLLERHAPEQVLHAALDRLRGVAVERPGRLAAVSRTRPRTECYAQRPQSVLRCHGMFPGRWAELRVRLIVTLVGHSQSSVLAGTYSCSHRVLSGRKDLRGDLTSSRSSSHGLLDDLFRRLRREGTVVHPVAAVRTRLLGRQVPGRPVAVRNDQGVTERARPS